MREITQRRSWRLWATPALAARPSAGRRVRPVPRPGMGAEPPLEVAAANPSEAALARRAARIERDEAQLDAALAHIEAMLARTDTLLTRDG